MLAARWLLTVGVLWPNASNAQRHLPGQQIFHTPSAMIIDGGVESPAVYSGVSGAPAVGVGQTVGFQVFVPRAASELGFSLRIRVTRADGSPAAGLEIAEARDWADRLLLPVAGGDGRVHAASLPRFDRIPATGHVATVLIRPLDATAFQSPSRVEAWVTFVSDPPGGCGSSGESSFSAGSEKQEAGGLCDPPAFLVNRAPALS